VLLEADTGVTPSCFASDQKAKKFSMMQPGVLKEREESEIEDAVAKDCFERRGTFSFLFLA